MPDRVAERADQERQEADRGVKDRDILAGLSVQTGRFWQHERAALERTVQRLDAVTALVEAAREACAALEYTGRVGDHTCCGGPHTAYGRNPYGHAVSCPIRALRTALTPFTTQEDPE